MGGTRLEQTSLSCEKPIFTGKAHKDGAKSGAFFSDSLKKVVDAWPNLSSEKIKRVMEIIEAELPEKI